MSEELLRAELAEARRVARLLYQDLLTPQARRALGDVSGEWPWLFDDTSGFAGRARTARRTIRVTPEQKAKTLRDAARNSRVKVNVWTLRRLVEEQLERDRQR